MGRICTKAFPRGSSAYANAWCLPTMPPTAVVDRPGGQASLLLPLHNPSHTLLTALGSIDSNCQSSASGERMKEKEKRMKKKKKKELDLGLPAWPSESTRKHQMQGSVLFISLLCLLLLSPSLPLFSVFPPCPGGTGYCISSFGCNQGE